MTSSWLSPGKSAAVALTFDVDAETGVLSMDAKYAKHAMTMTHQAFGPDIGVPRILGILKDLQVPATFYFPGWVAERRPNLVAQVAEAGHEIAHHSYSHVPASSMTAAEERRDFERALEVFKNQGVDIYGHRAGLWEASWQTASLVAEYGLLYDSSLMNDDRPYHVPTESGSVVELPPHWSLDDWEQYAFLPAPQIGSIIEEPLKVLSMWKYELDAMRRYNSLFMLTNHPFLTGRAGRAEALRSLIEYGQSCDDVEFVTCREIAERAKADDSLATRPLQQPDIEAGVFPTS
ncbi:polysaccharide deacetylase family protein [Saccharopolyspora pogona]|uniref:polysaccharide deacetylase family protein n=1 Tax=Saccharopolyspora pogona TaxID=333966 RepID=UPI001688C6F8|nr:polysaccharide deacetylase [Saccharopolyspora pogona]